MKKTTIIAFAFLAVTITMSLLIPTIATGLEKRNRHAVFIDSLSEHKSQPITQIIGIDEQKTLEDYGVHVSIQIQFTDNEEDCRISYPENVISIKEKNGVLTFALSDELKKKASDKTIINSYQEQHERNLKKNAQADHHTASAAEPTKDTDTATEKDGRNLIPDTVLIKKLNGIVEKHATMTKNAANSEIHIIVTTTPQLAKIKLGRRHTLYLGDTYLPVLQIAYMDQVKFYNQCNIDRLIIAGYGSIDWNNAVIKHIDYTLTPKPENDDYIYNEFTYGDKGKLGSITIMGKGSINNLHADKFEHIHIIPSQGNTLTVDLHTAKTGITVK